MADPPPPDPPAQDASTSASSATPAPGAGGTAAGASGEARTGPALLSIRGAASASGSTGGSPLPPPPPSSSSSAQPSTTTTAAGAKTVPGQKRPRFSFTLAASAAAASSSASASPKSPSKSRVPSSGTVGKNVFASLGKGKEKEKEGKKEAGEVDEEDLKALEELKRSTALPASPTSPRTSRATRTPSLPPKPILDPASPPPPPPPPPAGEGEGEEAALAMKRAGERNSYLEKMKGRERSVSGGREEGEEGEVRSRSGQRESWRAADERPSGSAGYANGYGHGRDHSYGNGYARGDWDRERRDSYSGPSRSRYDAPREYRGGGGGRHGPRPDYERQQYGSYGDHGGLPYDDQGGLPYGDEPVAPARSSATRESSRRHDDRRRDRDNYGGRDERRGGPREDRRDDYRRDRRDDRRGDDRPSSRRHHDDGYHRDRGYERPRISYENGDEDRHHPSKRHKTNRSPSPPPRRVRSRSPSRTPPSVHDSPSESGTPIDPYKEKSVLDPLHIKELEERVRLRRVSRDEESVQNGAMQDPRDRYADRSAPPPPPPPHQQHHQHYPPPPLPPSHLPHPTAFVPQAGFPPPPPPPAPHSSFIRPEPIHAPPHTAVPAGSRPASQPSESINPSPAVGAPAPSTSRDTAPTPVSSLQPTSSTLHVDPLPLNIRSTRSLEELWVREMNDAEVDELFARARAESRRYSPARKVVRKYVGCSHISEYSLNEKLGEGTFGVVWKGMRGGNKVAVSAAEAEKEKEEEEKLVKVGLRVRKGDVVALKQIIFHNEGDGLPITSVREIRILKMLDHPNVVPVVDIAYEPADAQNFTLGKTFMVFPYMDHDLAGLLENPRVKLETEHIKQYSKQLLEGTAYMHRNRILHRDMKAANLLINNKGQLMIADFGLARSIEAFEKNVEYTSCVVTRWYRPPELLLGEKRYHTPVDMWGVGCIMAEMWHRSPIFPGSSDMDQAVRIFASCGPPTDETMPGWRSLPGVEGHETVTWANNGRSVRADWAGKANDDLFGDLMDRILVLDPKKRLTANEALDHDWFWTEPFPCEPSRMPTYEASHELDRRKRVQDQHAAFGQPVQQMQQPMHARPAMPGYGNPPQQPYPNQHASAPFNGPPPPAAFNGPPPPAAFNGPPVAAYNAPPQPMANPYNAPAQQPYGGGGMGGMAGGGPHRSYAAAGPPVATVGARPMNGAYEPMRPSWQSQQARPTYGAPPAQAGAGRGGRVNLVQRLAKKQ